MSELSRVWELHYAGCILVLSIVWKAKRERWELLHPLRVDSKPNILFPMRHSQPGWIGEMSGMRSAYAELAGFPLDSDRYCS
jgi:hypothetical protein